MSTTVSFTGSLLTSALKGINEAGGTMRSAAGDVAKATQKQVNGVSSQADTVTISDAARDGGMDDGLRDVKQASYAHLANQKVVETADEQFEAQLDMVLGVPPR